MPDWWLRMQAQALRHGSGHCNAAENTADSTGKHGAQMSSQEPSTLRAGRCAVSTTRANSKESDSQYAVEDTDVSLIPKCHNDRSQNSLAPHDWIEPVYHHTLPDADDWHAEAQASAQSLTQKYVHNIFLSRFASCVHDKDVA
jgi:hypothetical protein